MLLDFYVVKENRFNAIKFNNRDIEATRKYLCYTTLTKKRQTGILNIPKTHNKATENKKNILSCELL